MATSIIKLAHFYLAMYWAEALAAQDEDAELKAYFSTLSKNLSDNEGKIVEELLAVQGKPVEMGGYYNVDKEKVSAAMRPSETLNGILSAL